MSLRTCGTFLATLLGLFCTTGDAVSQTIGVDAGGLAQEEERTRPSALSEQAARPAAPLAAPPPTMLTTADGGATLFVREWQFDKNTVFSDADLRKVLASYTGRALTFSEISAAATAIEAYYYAQGYLTRVNIPAQEVTQQTVQFEVIEARFAGVTFAGEGPKRVQPSRLARYFERAHDEGTLIQTARLDRPLLLINDLPGVSVTGALAPGRRPGETALVLTTDDAPLFSFGITADNFASRATGQERISFQARLASPFGVGDEAAFDLGLSKGNRNGKLSYAVPIGAQGLTGIVSAQQLTYDVIVPELRALDPSGSSRTLGATLRYPIKRTRDVNVTATAAYDVSNYRNSVSGSVVSDYGVSQLTFGLSGNWFDDVGGGGASNFSVSLAKGSVEDSDAGGAFDGSFVVRRFEFSRRQVINDKTRVFLGISGQFGPEGLDSSQGFSLGGPNGVRAYPSGEGDGPSGIVANLEVTQALTDSTSLTGFFDIGRVSGRTDPGEPSRYNLKGAGLALGWNGPNRITADLTLARRIGSNPNPITDPSRPAEIQGRDQDGSRSKIQLWVTLSKRF